jgi:hypothetical protein
VVRPEVSVRSEQNISCQLETSGPVDQKEIAVALRHVICEVRTLRVTFAEDLEGLHQTLCEPQAWEPDFFDVSHTADPGCAVRGLISELTHRAFDLSNDIMCRADPTCWPGIGS